MLNERIKERRKELAMTQEELARKTGYKTKGAISRIEKGERDLSQSQISAFAKALDVSPAYLMGWNDSPSDDIDISKIPGVIMPVKLKRIPILGTIACGEPIFAEENYEGYFMLDKNLPEADFCLKAKGDSMIDMGIHEGDLVFLRQQPMVENGEVGAVLIDNEATLKKIYINEHEIILQPCNRNYPPIVVKTGDIKIMGKLVGYYHNTDK
ncbi:transcriptional repressor LexA [Citroniella saccharovorans]|uniref:Transcriptional repressor LexA n=1 Tax=Citroniella saccharovorans TaxID=2053367 RepID=A0AAW9MMX2_9FIRM|nr:transcriptional repressor LexA [Citroniella saccharovorans]MEB3428888.1 transcriptional repressor LexA [Citroniella saccharovorans]